MMYCDAHTHLDLYRDHLQGEIIEKIKREHILTFANSVDLNSYHRTRKLAAGSPLIIPGLGLHPWYADEQRHILDEFDPLLQAAPFLVEIGFDFLSIDLPLNQLLTETDGPSGLEWVSGKIGRPAHI